MKGLNNSFVEFVDTAECPHSYFLDGVRIIGLTTLLRKHGITQDYSYIDPDVLARAAERGSQVHKECEVFDDWGTLPTHEWAVPYPSLGLKVIKSEFLVSYGTVVATQIDKILDDYSVCDIKTSSKIDEQGVRWQCSIGAYMLEKQCHVDVPHIYLIHLRDGKVTMRELERISNNEIEALLEAEINGELYCLTTTDVTIIDTSLQVSIKDILIQEKELSERKKELTDRIKEQMEQHKVKSIDNELFKVTYIAPTTKTTFDSKKALADNPDLDMYNKISEVKSSIRITLK